MSQKLWHICLILRFVILVIILLAEPADLPYCLPTPLYGRVISIICTCIYKYYLFHTYRLLNGISTVPHEPKTLTHQSADMNISPGTRSMALLHVILPGHGLIYYISSSTSMQLASASESQPPRAIYQCIKISPRGASVNWRKHRHLYPHFFADPRFRLNTTHHFWLNLTQFLWLNSTPVARTYLWLESHHVITFSVKTHILPHRPECP